MVILKTKCNDYVTVGRFIQVKLISVDSNKKTALIGIQALALMQIESCRVSRKLRTKSNLQGKSPHIKNNATYSLEG